MGRGKARDREVAGIFAFLGPNSRQSRLRGEVYQNINCFLTDMPKLEFIDVRRTSKNFHPDSNWNSGSSTMINRVRSKLPINWVGLIYAIIAAVIFTVIIAWTAFIEDMAIYQDADRNSDQYERMAREKIAEKCRMLPSDTKYDCIDEIKETSRDRQRKEYDLYSQRAMALWTSVMGGMAVIGVALSMIVAYLIWETWRETGAAVIVMRNEQRPWLSVSDIKVSYLYCGPSEDNDTGHLMLTSTMNINFRISNVGKSPALSALGYAEFVEPFQDRRYEQKLNLARNRLGGYSIAPDSSKREECSLISFGGRIEDIPRRTEQVRMAIRISVFYKSKSGESHEIHETYRVLMRQEPDVEGTYEGLTYEYTMRADVDRLVLIPEGRHEMT